MVNRFFLEMSREQMPGYGKVSIGQVRLVDKEIFARLAEHSRKGFDTLEFDPGLSQLSLDKVLEKVLDEPRISTLLMPLPSFSKQIVNKPETNKRQQQAIDNLQAEVKRLKAKGSKGGEKGAKGARWWQSQRCQRCQQECQHAKRAPRYVIGI